MNKMYLVLGDWSSDGHGKYDKILLESNLEIGDVQKAYKDSCKLTKVDFDGNIASDYGDSKLSYSDFEKLSKYGLTSKMLTDWAAVVEDEEDIYMCQETFINLWIWFVRLSNKDLILTDVDAKEQIPSINGYWSKELNVSFGYGLYD